LVAFWMQAAATPEMLIMATVLCILAQSSIDGGFLMAIAQAGDACLRSDSHTQI